MGLVWPVVRDKCGGGVIIPVETVSDSGFAAQLDMLAGIDAWQQLVDGVAGDVLRGIATRVQFERCFPTFTVRRSLSSGRPTEYDKRRAAMNGRGYLYPHLTVQAYVSGGSLVLVGVAETSSVIDACSEDRVRTNRADNNTFYWIPFSTVSGAWWHPREQVSAASGGIDSWRAAFAAKERQLDMFRSRTAES